MSTINIWQIWCAFRIPSEKLKTSLGFQKLYCRHYWGMWHLLCGVWIGLQMVRGFQTMLYNNLLIPQSGPVPYFCTLKACNLKRKHSPCSHKISSWPLIWVANLMFYNRKHYFCCKMSNFYSPVSEKHLLWRGILHACIILVNALVTLFGMKCQVSILHLYITMPAPISVESPVLTEADVAQSTDLKNQSTCTVKPEKIGLKF